MRNIAFPNLLKTFREYVLMTAGLLIYSFGWIACIKPMEVAAGLARQEFCKRYGADPEEVGCFFITPCAAKMTAVKSPVGQEKSHVDGVIAIKDVYAQMRAAMKQGFSPLEIDRASVVGIKWAIPGGEVEAVGIKSSLCVDGIDNVINVLYVPDSANLPDDIEVPTDTTPPSAPRSPTSSPWVSPPRPRFSIRSTTRSSAA